MMHNDWSKCYMFTPKRGVDSGVMTGEGNITLLQMSPKMLVAPKNDVYNGMSRLVFPNHNTFKYFLIIPPHPLGSIFLL